MEDGCRARQLRGRRVHGADRGRWPRRLRRGGRVACVDATRVGGVGGRRQTVRAVGSRMGRLSREGGRAVVGKRRASRRVRRCRGLTSLFARPCALVVASRADGGAVVSFDFGGWPRSRSTGREAEDITTRSKVGRRTVFGRSALNGVQASLNDRCSGYPLRRTAGWSAVLRCWCLTCACS